MADGRAPLGLVVPAVDSPLFASAVSALRKHKPQLAVSPSQLGVIYSSLLQLPARRLVRLGLVSQEDMRSAITAQVTTSDLSGEQSRAFRIDNGIVAGLAGLAVSGSGAAALSVPAAGPIRKLLLEYGVDLPPRQIALLLHAIQAPPILFAKLGLIPAEALRKTPDGLPATEHCTSGSPPCEASAPPGGSGDADGARCTLLGSQGSAGF
ncbi:hypothetical protein JKP88DRAFT_346748 [Tribonema minus]|uniref:Uncharacterized protein n=1 Tax=Tribonema minus TaxID=303371 RepID=A0A835Z388_9STRA|nr:hypothetical protein JKP88DRAFT_346748 [Tribonema minus]